MSSPGMSQDDEQQPLFGQPTVNPLILALQQAQAQRMGQGGPDSGPIVSPWQAADRVVSPLISALMQKHLANKQMQMQQAAMPEIQAALKSNDPLGALMNSKSPLVQQMAMQYMPDFMKGQMGLHNKIAERTAIDPLDVKKAIDTASGTEPIEVKKATDIAAATIPLEIQKAVGIAKGTLPIDLAKARAGQAVGFADLAEKKREYDLTQGGSAGGTPGPLGQNPAALYGAHP